MQDDIDAGRVREVPGGAAQPAADRRRCCAPSRRAATTRSSAARRRDEEKARAKERFFSFRDAFGQWDPKNQRPELWNLYNGRHAPGEHIRVFPLSNWTELDVWRYIAREGIEVPSIYFAHEREVFERDGMLLGVTEHSLPRDRRGRDDPRRALPHRRRRLLHRRRRVAGAHPEEVVDEVAATRITERGATRADDRASEAAMEDRKKEGYF